MKRFILSILSLLPLFLHAERVASVAEFYETEFTNQGIAWLDRGAEIWIEEDKTNSKRLKVYAKVWVNRKEIKRGTADKNAALYTKDGKVIGGLYIPLHTKFDSTGGFSKYCLELRGYIFRDRVDQNSIIEKELIKILTPKKGKVTKTDLAGFLKKFELSPGRDTLEFSMLEYYEKDEPRLTLVFRGEDLVALIPVKTFDYKNYVAELKQDKLRIIYLHKLNPAEEAFFADFFSPR